MATTIPISAGNRTRVTTYEDLLKKLVRVNRDHARRTAQLAKATTRRNELRTLVVNALAAVDAAYVIPPGITKLKLTKAAGKVTEIKHG